MTRREDGCRGRRGMEGVTCSKLADRLGNTMHMDVTVEPDGRKGVTMSRQQTPARQLSRPH